MAERSLCSQTPEVGAECPNWARSDLCGGRAVMRVPTAIGSPLSQANIWSSYDAVVGSTDQFCRDHLTDEYRYRVAAGANEYFH